MKDDTVRYSYCTGMVIDDDYFSFFVLVQGILLCACSFASCCHIIDINYICKVTSIVQHLLVLMYPFGFGEGRLD